MKGDSIVMAPQLWRGEYVHGRCIHRRSHHESCLFPFFFFQAEDGIRDIGVTGVQTCALPIDWPITLAAVYGSIYGSFVGVMFAMLCAHFATRKLDAISAGAVLGMVASALFAI